MLTRKLILISFFIIISISNNSLATDIRITLQNKIDIDAPLIEATFFGTHNSYNSAHYQSWKYPTRYRSPNQKLSVKKQLEAGARFIEYDIHWYNHLARGKFKKALVLCHGTNTHIGCSINDRSIEEGFNELKKWLQENQEEVVLLYIDRHISGQHNKLAKAIQKQLGDYVFTPNDIENNNNNNTCPSIPRNLTKRNILNKGKSKGVNSQVIIFIKNCLSNYHTELDNWIFTGFNNNPKAPLETGVERFENIPRSNSSPSIDVYPICGKDNAFSYDPTHLFLWRIFEDRAPADRAVKAGRLIFTEDVKIAYKCGINIINLDNLKEDDNRMINGGIWSFASGYPKNFNAAIALFSAEKNLMVDVSLNSLEKYPAACKNFTSKEWQASPPVTWQKAVSACQKLGKDWQFAVPINGLQMQQLKDVITPLGISTWLNYVAKDGNWIANKSLSQLSHLN